MKFFSSIAIILPVTAPLAAGKFLLQSEVKAEQAAELDRFNGLYVAQQHTGPSTADVVMLKNKQFALKGAVKKGHMVFDNPDNAQDFTYGLGLTSMNYYDRWSKTTADVGKGDKGFKVKNGTLVGTGSDSSYLWGGWRICDWVHDEPQLFYNTKGQHAQKDIVGCADVNLKVVQV